MPLVRFYLLSRSNSNACVCDIIESRGGGGGYSTGIRVGGFGRPNETLTLFKRQKM